MGRGGWWVSGCTIRGRMRAATDATKLFPSTLAALLVLAGCARGSGAGTPPNAGGPGRTDRTELPVANGGACEIAARNARSASTAEIPPTDAGAPIETGEACGDQAVLLGLHPHAAEQPTPKGRTLAEAIGWHGRVYFGYGDLEANTGPIEISALDPASGTWQDVLLFHTEQVARFRVIGDALWAPANDPRGTEDPEIAIGTREHVWSEQSIGRSLHVHDVAALSPEDVFLVGSDTFDFMPGAWGAAVWRSSGSAWTEILPVAGQAWDPTTYALTSVVALRGKIYAETVGPAWVHDGATWIARADVGALTHPVNFGDVVVFETLGTLWSFDGTEVDGLGVRLAPQPPGAVPMSLHAAAEGHLIAVTRARDVIETRDLKTWRCIGRAPEGAASIAVLEGRVFFGATEAKVFALPNRSW
jgi:hypothetical protein